MQYQSCCAPKLARKCEIEHWFPCGADGRAGGVREVITKFSGMVRFTCPWCSEGALRSPELRYEELHGIFHGDDNIKLQAVFSSRKGLVKRGK